MSNTKLALLALAGCSTPPADEPTRYLTFQSFIGANGAPGESAAPTPWQRDELKAKLEAYVAAVQARLQPDTITPVANRRYGVFIGPITLEQTDADIALMITTAFDVAIETKVPFGVHFDISHFWKYARATDGTLLSDADASYEWSDWSGTRAPPDGWGGDPMMSGLLPSMCLACDPIHALVDHTAGDVIVPAIAAGLARLAATGDDDLFAGVIVGWEAGSLNPLGYHSLSIGGYTSATSLADLNKAQQHILHDYLQRWTKTLAEGGVPTAKMYTHTANMSQDAADAAFAMVKQHLSTDDAYQSWLWMTLGNGPDSFWDSFTDYGNGGFSWYADGVSTNASGMMAIWAAAAGTPWAEAEGTNLNTAGSTITWETYLGWIFDHGGRVANIFGGFLGSGAGDYGTSTESDEARDAYRKWLGGGTLVVSP